MGLIPTIVLPYALSMFFPVSPSLGWSALVAERFMPENRPPLELADVEGTFSDAGVGCCWEPDELAAFWSAIS